MTDELRRQLIRHEGLELKPYRCTAGKLTIGVGRNIEDVGISRDEALMLLENDIRECHADLYRIFPAFHGIAPGRQYALVDLRFNLGPSRFRTFRRMIAAVQAKDWDAAADELIDSRWWHQVQDDRKTTLHRQLKDGV